MKKISTILTVFLFTLSLFAQAPQKMSYQAVIRDATGNLVTEKEVGMRISILFGSADGVAVYSETHTPTTNANGLVSLEIGGGEGFDAIDWGINEYFIRIETDPAGGTNYTITGTSQILSVPYALTAKTVETVDYSKITNTPIIPDDLSDLTDNTNLLFDGNYNSLSNLPTLFSGSFADLTNTPTNIAGYGITDAFDGAYSSLTGVPVNATTTTDGFMSSADKTKLDDLQNTNITAGTGISVTGTYPDISIATTILTYAIGLNEDLGGYVFYVTPDGKHGLVAATQNQCTSCTWYNAQDIISNPANHNTAGEKFTDWRLPTKYELNLMYSQRTNIGAFTANWYWSSTESNYSNAWIQSLGDGGQTNPDKNYTGSIVSVRAVRAF